MKAVFIDILRMIVTYLIGFMMGYFVLYFFLPSGTEVLGFSIPDVFGLAACFCLFVYDIRRVVNERRAIINAADKRIAEIREQISKGVK